MSDEFTVIPVVENFDINKVIGELRIRSDSIPKTCDFVFSLCVRYDGKIEPDQLHPKLAPYHGPYELLCISPIPEEAYIGYLRQAGRIPL